MSLETLTTLYFVMQVYPKENLFHVKKKSISDQSKFLIGNLSKARW